MIKLKVKVINIIFLKKAHNKDNLQMKANKNRSAKIRNFKLRKTTQCLPGKPWLANVHLALIYEII